MNNENKRHLNLTIGIGDTSSNDQARVINIENDGVVLGFGPNYTNVTKVSFSDCELLWEV